MKRIVAVLLSAFVASAGFAGTLFVDSSPPGATVVINGQTLERTTPLITTSEGFQSFTIRISKPGYLTRVESVTIDTDDVAEVSVTLEPDFVLMGFPEDQSVLRLQGELPPASFVRLPRGRYEVGRDDNGVVLTPLYRHDALIGGLSVGTALGLATTITSVFVDTRSDLRISPATVLSGVATLVLGVTDAVFLTRRARFFSEVAPVVIPVNPLEAQLLLERAEIALQAGSLAFAEESLAAYVELVPQAERAAESLYRRARILVSMGEFDRAIEVFERILEDYPRPEFYDRAIMGLAEAYGRDGSPERGLEALNQITFVRPAPTPEDVDFRRADLLELAAFADDAVLDRRVNAWLTLVRDYPGSANRGYYRLAAADALLDAERPEEALELVEEVEPDESLARLYEAVRTRLRTLGYE